MDWLLILNLLAAFSVGFAVGVKALGWHIQQTINDLPPWNGPTDA